MTVPAPLLPSVTTSVVSTRSWPTGSGVVPATLAASVVLLLALQVLSLADRDPLHDTLSSYVHLDHGWLFGAALVVLAVGLWVAGRQWRAQGFRPAGYALQAAALTALVAAAFPADPSGADRVSVAGHTHKWASIALMVLLGLGALLARDQLAAGVRAVTALLVVAGVCGSAFLAGQWSKWSSGDPVLAASDRAPFLGGLTQRLLVLSLVLAVWFLAVRAERRALPLGAGR